MEVESWNRSLACWLADLQEIAHLGKQVIADAYQSGTVPIRFTQRWPRGFQIAERRNSRFVEGNTSAVDRQPFAVIGEFADVSLSTLAAAGEYIANCLRHCVRSQ